MEEDFKLIVDDPSGNSFIENPYIPSVGNHDRIYFCFSHLQCVYFFVSIGSYEISFCIMWWIPADIPTI